MQKEIGMILKDRMLWALNLRGELIGNRLVLMDQALEQEDKAGIYRHLFELSQLTETLCRELREATIQFFSNLQLIQFYPILLPYPHGGEVKAFIKDGCIHLEAPAILPYCHGGSTYYLHEQVRWALEDLIRGRKLPRPFFTQRCALVYLHHYREGAVRYLRDYDNVEHRCVTNALAALAMWGDSPDCILALDILAPGEREFTEIRIMPIEQFRQFIMSENIGYQPDGTIAK